MLNVTGKLSNGFSAGWIRGKAGEKANTKPFQRWNHSSSDFMRHVFGRWCDYALNFGHNQDAITDSAVDDVRG